MMNDGNSEPGSREDKQQGSGGNIEDGELKGGRPGRHPSGVLKTYMRERTVVRGETVQQNDRK